MNTESSGSESEGDDERPQFVSTTPLGEPFMRFQGAYLCNLLKLLNESTHTQMAAVMRWHPKIANALQINWKELNVQFDRVTLSWFATRSAARRTSSRACGPP